MITRSAYSFSSNSIAKAWTLQIRDSLKPDFTAEFKRQKDAQAALDINSRIGDQSLYEFETDLACHDHQGSAYADHRVCTYDGFGRFRVISSNQYMERDEIVEAIDLLDRIRWTHE